MLAQSEWITLEFDHPLLDDMEVKRVVYEGGLGEPEKIEMWVSTPHRRSQMIAELLGKIIAFRLTDAENTLYFNHWLSEIKWQIGKGLDGHEHYVLTWQSPLAKLKQTNLSLLLHDVSVREAFRLILSGQLISKSPLTLQQHELQVMRVVDGVQAPLKAHQESLMTVFKRLLAFNGMTYFFDHSHEACPLIITDCIQKIGQVVDVAEYRYAEGDLLTNPFIDRVKTRYSASSAFFKTSGHPDLQPQILLEEDVQRQDGFGGFHAGFAERSMQAVTDRAKWGSEYDMGQSERSIYSGGGIVFAGQIMKVQAQLLVTSAWTLELDGAMKNRIKQIQTRLSAQSLALPYREKLDFNARQILMTGHAVAQNKVTVDAMGGYEVNVPPYFIQNKPCSLEANRMIYPLQSDDHRQYYTLMPEAETLSLWWGSMLNQSLILGTLNSTHSPQLTQQETSQNAYWQDGSGNRVAFINEGLYLPTQKTGRKSAHILETPNYHPNGFSNYVRMGDSIKQDSCYRGQAVAPGIFTVTEGSYHETHRGGLMELAGNMGTDQDNPLPALRHRVELNPSFGQSHILKTVTAHLHTTIMTSDQVREHKTLDAVSLTQTLDALHYDVQHEQDESRGIYVNQMHHQTGAQHCMQVNSYQLLATAQQRTLNQTGEQRTDQYHQKTLQLNHPLNTLQYQTLKQNVKAMSQQTRIEVNHIKNYSRSHQQCTQRANQFSQQNQTMQSIVGHTYFSDGLDLVVSEGSALPSDSVLVASKTG